VANIESIGSGLLSESVEVIRGVPQKVLKFDVGNSQKYNLFNMLDRIIIGPHPAAEEIVEAIRIKLASKSLKSLVAVSNIPYRG